MGPVSSVRPWSAVYGNAVGSCRRWFGSRKRSRSLDRQAERLACAWQRHEPSGLEQAVTGTDVLVHNAGVYEFGADSDAAKRMQTVNVEGTQNMLAAAKAAG